MRVGTVGTVCGRFNEALARTSAHVDTRVLIAHPLEELGQWGDGAAVRVIMGIRGEE